MKNSLDYDWRFGDKATDYLLERCLELTDAEDYVVLLGTPTVSRWDDRRRLVDVWTSGNRTF